MSALDSCRVTLVKPSVIASYAGANVNFSNTVLVVFANDGKCQTRYIANDHNGGLSERNSRIIEYSEELLKDFADLKSFPNGQQYYFLFQGDDNPVDHRSVSWQTQVDFSTICLVPDFYYTRNRGYTSFFTQDVPDWNSKATRFFWRGSTTGGWNITLDSLHKLPRYKLCRAGLSVGQRADFAFYNVVQSISNEEKEKIEAVLRAENLIRNYVTLDEYAKYKFFVQIDGNGNSWELVKKFRIGSCMLLVDSKWMLYHYTKIRAWEHYIPVKNDLSDLETIVEWCLAHDAEAEEIAKNGRKFALSIDYQSEMRAAANSVCEHAQGVELLDVPLSH